MTNRPLASNAFSYLSKAAVANIFLFRLTLLINLSNIVFNQIINLSNIQQNKLYRPIINTVISINGFEQKIKSGSPLRLLKSHVRILVMSTVMISIR